MINLRSVNHHINNHWRWVDYSLTLGWLWWGCTPPFVIVTGSVNHPPRFSASLGAHSSLASLSKIWVWVFFWFLRKISGVIFFIFSKFWFFGLFGALRNRKNGQKNFSRLIRFFDQNFFWLRIGQFAKKSCFGQFLKFWFFAPRYPPPQSFCYWKSGVANVEVEGGEFDEK